MDAHPTQLELIDAGRLQIVWSDGEVRQYGVSELRNACPCATCREKRKSPPASSSALPVLSAAEAQPTAIAKMTPVGNYAYSIVFSDGHDTGIFTFEQLRELGEAVAGA